MSISACGSGTTLDGDRDGSGRRPATTVVDDEEQVFELVSMTPETESHTATPLSAVELTFNLRVDADSVDGIILRERESERIVRANLEVDGDKVRLVPLIPLSRNSRYALELTGVRSTVPDTNTVDEKARFFTAPNFETLYLRYQTGVAVKAHVFDWNPHTREHRSAHYQPGNDGVVLTPDDWQDVRVVARYDADMDMTWRDVRAGAGADEAYDTDDDQRVYLREITYAAAGATTQVHTFYGDDLVVGNADDYTETTTYVYDAADRLSLQCVEDTCTSYEYGGSTLEVPLVDPGPDEQWQTPDDLLGKQYARSISNELGLEVSKESYERTESEPRLLSYTEVTYDERNLATEVRTFTDPGADLTWYTSDDVSQSRVIMTYDEDGWLLTRHAYAAGEDGVLETIDDEIKASWYFQANQ